MSNYTHPKSLATLLIGVPVERDAALLERTAVAA